MTFPLKLLSACPWWKFIWSLSVHISLVSFTSIKLWWQIQSQCSEDWFVFTPALCFDQCTWNKVIFLMHFSFSLWSRAVTTLTEQNLTWLHFVREFYWNCNEGPISFHTDSEGEGTHLLPERLIQSAGFSSEILHRLLFIIRSGLLLHSSPSFFLSLYEKETG